MNELQCVFVANGDLQASQVRGFLEASGVATTISGESLRGPYGLSVGVGAVEILVADADYDRARALLAEADAGLLRLPDHADVRDDGGPLSSSE